MAEVSYFNILVIATFIALLVLKLLGEIGLSWWIVTLPLWIIPAIVLAIILIGLIISIISGLIGGIFGK